MPGVTRVVVERKERKAREIFTLLYATYAAIIHAPRCCSPGAMRVYDVSPVACDFRRAASSEKSGAMQGRICSGSIGGYWVIMFFHMYRGDLLHT